MDRKNEYGALAPYYDIFIDWDKRLALEIPFILDHLPRRPAGMKCLDIGCGTGRHLERLRQAGFDVEGCEPSPALRFQAVHNLPGAVIHPHPMEQLAELAAERGPWNLAICLGNTLAHLAPGQLKEFFIALADAISPGGVAVIHLLGYDRIMRLRPKNLAEKTAERDNHTYVFQRDYTYLDQEIEFTLRVIVDGKLEAEQRETLYPLRETQLREYCGLAGFTQVRTFDGFDSCRPYSQDSANLVCVLSR